MMRLGLAVIRLLSLLPFALLTRVGAGIGMLLYALAGARRRVVLKNLELCFPEMDADARRRLDARHFRAFGRSLLEHGILWWGSRDEVQKLVRIEGLEHWRDIAEKPVILLAPHFIGLDMGGIRLVTEYRLEYRSYSRQKSDAAEAILMHGRMRFGNSTLFARQDGIRPMIKSLKAGEPFYYLPDMDLGARRFRFRAGLQRADGDHHGAIAHCATDVGRSIIPCVTRQLPGTAGYVVRFYPPWNDFPSDDPVADAHRMNAFHRGARARDARAVLLAA